MKTTGQFINDTLQHSFLILWKEDKQKWEVGCALLKINLQADTYAEAIQSLAKAILDYNLSQEFSNAIEEYREDYLKSNK
ncbi:hypothetical protein [Acinetobacter sp. NIPH 298]|uniref:hypothetical protein n=1 Tax=Acinetobacter sp. NIPH 298 TaxID=1217692 RepID=UPI0002CEE2B5|nr:hypothetical protein [Acinetobacter sp. NIPH 298]ENW95802.1 hypothetical protein F903_01564 [Acinetobacter sp. NIPH 298]